MIVIDGLPSEQAFTEYYRRRGELRDCLRFGVYPNLVQALSLHNKFIADYGPGGALHDPALWAYYQANIAPVADVQAQMMTGAEAIVAAMEQVEAAAPGTFGITPRQVYADTEGTE